MCPWPEVIKSLHLEKNKIRLHNVLKGKYIKKWKFCHNLPSVPFQTWTTVFLLWNTKGDILKIFCVGHSLPCKLHWTGLHKKSQKHHYGLFFLCILFNVLSKAHSHLKQERYISIHTNAQHFVYYKCTLLLYCRLLQMLELSKAGWILIGCQCFYHSSTRKNVFFLESDCN